MPRLRRLADLLPFAVAAWLLALLASVWSARLSFPHDLEWMEGGMLAHAWRLTGGLPLYPAPGPDFVPFVYPPGYASLLALVGGVVGLDHEVGRTIALLGVFSAAGAISWGVTRQTGHRGAGLLGAAVFLGAYPASGAYYDLVRPDGLYVGLLAWALVIGLERSRGADVAAGLLLAAAFAMKHNAAAFGLPIAVGLFARDGWRSAVRFSLAAALPAGALTLFMQIVSEGRFLVYLVEVPSAHPRYWGRAMPGLPRELGMALPIATAASALWFVLRLERWVPGLHPGLAVGLPAVGGVALAWAGTSLWAFGPEVRPFPSAFAFWAIGASAVAVAIAVGGAAVDLARRVRPRLSWRFVYGVGVLAVGLAVAALMRAHNGGYTNVYMHLHWIVAFGFAVIVARSATSSPVPAVLGSLAIAGQLGWQIATLDRAQLTPSHDDVEAARQFVRAISSVEGPVLSPFAAWLPVAAGKPPSLHHIALWDLDYPGGPYHSEVARIEEALAAHYWGAVIDGSRPFGHGLKAHYRVAKRIELKEGVLWPRTGWQVRLERVWVPREADRR